MKLPPLFCGTGRVLRRDEKPVDIVRRVRDGAARGVDGKIFEQYGRDVAALAQALIEVIAVAIVCQRLSAEVQHDAVVESAVAHRAGRGKERREVKVV